MRTYARDRATGHPAAAADLLRQNQWALHSGCGGGAGVGRGLLGGLGGYRNAPVYNNYGGYNGGYGGRYNGVYNHPSRNSPILSPMRPLDPFPSQQQHHPVLELTLA